MTTQISKDSIILAVQGNSHLMLRAAAAADLEDLRQWKNDQREFFFYKNEISLDQQKIWYAAFQSRPLDLMFMTILDGQSFGCMGIRWLDNAWDIYNVILGRPEFGGRGLMSQAFKTMLAHALSVKRSPIALQVLKHNPAVKWYLKNQFVITAERDDHYAMLFKFNSNQQDTP